ncbi:type III secretion system chaperone [Roseovarius sp. CAU 1744]|uniref:type III secretion system chaperone n=1 Tax=Roseovarius sp. CAU 1744 TaxID=3140368 RepID=UPI00325B0CD3
MRRYLLAFCLAIAPLTLAAQEDPETAEPPMTLERLGQIIEVLDAEAKTNGAAWQLTIADTMIFVITDEDADRMRAMTPIRRSEEVTPEEMIRLMQANFDSALDARYAIAQGTLWATFIHPLSPLEKDQFISGLGQAVNLVKTYGTLYSGGAMQFGGGDSNAIQRELIDELLKKGEEI